MIAPVVLLLAVLPFQSVPDMQLRGVVREKDGRTSSHHYTWFRNAGALGDAVNKAIADRVRVRQDEFFARPSESFPSEGAPDQLINTTGRHFSPSLISATTRFHQNRGSTFITHNFAMVEGKPKSLAFVDLIVNRKSARQIASGLVMPKLRAQESLDLSQLGDTLPEAMVDRFSIDVKGLTWPFGGSEVGGPILGRPGTAGSAFRSDVMVLIPWSELKPYLSPDAPLQTVRPESG